MAPGTSSSNNLVDIIGTSNFEILESQTVWPIEVEKSGRFYILPLSPGLQTFIVTFATIWMYPVQTTKSVHTR